MKDSNIEIKGLSDSEVTSSRAKYGTNTLTNNNKNPFFTSLLDMIKEPMFLLLITATSIYFITGEYGDGFFMIVAILLISTISLYQEAKSRNAIDSLKKLSQQKVK